MSLTTRMLCARQTLPDRIVSKGLIPRAKNVRTAHDCSLQNRIVVRVADNHTQRCGHRVDNLTDGGQKSQISIYSFGSERPACLHVGVGEDAPDFCQNRGGEDEHVRARRSGQKQVAGQSLRRNPWVGANEDVRVEDDPHERQIRRGRTCESASVNAACISSGVASWPTFEAI